MTLHRTSTAIAIVGLLGSLFVLTRPPAIAQSSNQPAIAITQTNPVVLGGACTNGVATGTAAGSASPTCATSPAVSGDYVLTADGALRRNTADAADNGIVYLTGAGAIGQTRGAYVQIAGNEQATAGTVRVYVGNIAGAAFEVYRADGTLSEQLDGATGLHSLLYGQLKFPATQNPSSDVNALDDYEEGTWTVTDVSGAGLALTVSSGNYTKIGRRVSASTFVTFPATGSGSNAAFGGLPFTSQATAQNVSGCLIASSSETTLSSMFVTASATTIGLLNSAGAPLTDATLSGDTIRFDCLYNAVN